MSRAAQIRMGLILLAPLWWTTTSAAQPIKIRPGYVRAPFVRVQTNPDGSTFVRAPFVQVNTPGYGPFPPAAVPVAPPAWPAPHASYRRVRVVPPMPAPLQPGTMITACDNLSNYLNSIPTGAYWVRQLRLIELRNVVAQYGTFAVPAEVLPQLQEILVQFDVISQTTELGNLARIRSFQFVHQGLRTMTAPAVEFAAPTEEGPATSDAPQTRELQGEELQAPERIPNPAPDSSRPAELIIPNAP